MITFADTRVGKDENVGPISRGSVNEGEVVCMLPCHLAQWAERVG
jgi:hypothetical protein